MNRAILEETAYYLQEWRLNPCPGWPEAYSVSIVTSPSNRDAFLCLYDAIIQLSMEKRIKSIAVQLHYYDVRIEQTAAVIGISKTGPSTIDGEYRSTIFLSPDSSSFAALHDLGFRRC